MFGSTSTSEPAIRPATGFFGKLPGRGDFIGRHLPKSFLDPWDAWLQETIATSRLQLGGGWRECYCTSPIWRFALGSGVCGPTAYAGILMPSVDRVGRYYPLAIAVPLERDRPLLALPVAAEPWFQQAERLALFGLDLDRLDLDDFSRQVEALGGPPTLLAPPIADASAGAPWYCPLSDAPDAGSLAPLLADALLQRLFSHISLWWTEGSEQVARCLLICDGLPPVSGFVALLAGEWSQWGWREQPFAGVACSREGKPSAEENRA